MANLPRGDGTPKAVTIVEESESISPGLEPIGEESVSTLQQPESPKRRRASMAKRLSGRASITPTSSFQNLSLTPSLNVADTSSNSDLPNDAHGRLIVQLLAWLAEEKAQRDLAVKQQHSTNDDTNLRSTQRQDSSGGPVELRHDIAPKRDTDPSLQKLEKILSESIEYAQKMTPAPTVDYQGFNFGRRKSSIRKLRKSSTVHASSDTEYQDGDAIVPSADVVLDNTKTLGYSGGEAQAETEPDGDASSGKQAAKDKDGWKSFKYEIVRLTHTLRLKGWRRVALDKASEIEVIRLSGALTNAVYVVSPPSNLPSIPGLELSSNPLPKRSPPKLLLRVYGPQVEHLIDRESELQILRRLARQNIGPRMLGTFENGRFEQYFNAKPLDQSDLRNPDTSKQIAKRMRELHDNIELLPSERAAGPFVWQNWDKWVNRCEEVITWLDNQIMSQQGPVKSRSEAYKLRGFVCGVEWARFRKAVDNYRKWLDERYGGKKNMRTELVFAHNDTQYGNLLRLEPSGESPLLLPANEHKQLVVIDFEYANANTPGLEFANHFTEWCYNYHSPTKSYACNAAGYPTPEEQHRFIQAYVQHVPGYNIKSPKESPTVARNSSISNFMLDSRGPPTSYDAEEKAREDKAQREVERLKGETRLWRVANSAQWVAWGIVQAKVPGMDEALEEARKKKRNLAERLVARLVHPHGKSHWRAKSSERPNGAAADAATDGIAGTTTTWEQQQDEDEPNRLEAAAKTEEAIEQAEAADEEVYVPHEHETDDEANFDYLAYAQERALFFWGDLLELGLVQDEDLPETVRQNAKRINY